MIVHSEIMKVLNLESNIIYTPFELVVNLDLTITENEIMQFKNKNRYLYKIEVFVLNTSPNIVKANKLI
jgi:hypothetical protein